MSEEDAMRILSVGGEGATAAFCTIANRRGFFDAVVVADHDLARAERAIKAGDDRFDAVQLESSSVEDLVALVDRLGITHVVNTDPGLVMPVFEAAFAAGVDYLDLTMSGSTPHQAEPYTKSGVKLGDEQFAVDGAWIDAGRLALVGIGASPGLADVFARYAADHLFSEIGELSTRCAPAALGTDALDRWLAPPVIWELDRGWFTTEPLSEAEMFAFPAGIGSLTCVNVEHEEVLLMPRWVDAQRTTFKYGLGGQLVAALGRSREGGLDHAELREAGASEDWADRSCVGVLVMGLGRDRRPRSTYLYHVVDSDWSMREYGHQGLAWQTAVGSVIALELLAREVWAGAGVLGPEAFDPVPFLELLAELGPPWQQREQ
jgi:saccharopine dehydrogenase (NAD+, L-lysine forming)